MGARPSDRKQVGALIYTELWEELRHLAIDKRTTASALLNEAIRWYIDKLKKGVEHPRGSTAGRAGGVKMGGHPTQPISKSVKKAKGEEK